MKHSPMLKSICFCSLAMASTASWSAQAATVLLTCDQGPEYGVNRFRHIAIDLTHKIVNNLPAQISYPALINPVAIDWESEVECPGCGDSSRPNAHIAATQHDHIDRVNGTLTSSLTRHYGAGHDSTGTSAPYPCTITNASQTKS